MFGRNLWIARLIYLPNNFRWKNVLDWRCSLTEICVRGTGARNSKPSNSQSENLDGAMSSENVSGWIIINLVPKVLSLRDSTPACEVNSYHSLVSSSARCDTWLCTPDVIDIWSWSMVALPTGSWLTSVMGESADRQAWRGLGAVDSLETSLW